MQVHNKSENDMVASLVYKVLSMRLLRQLREGRRQLKVIWVLNIRIADTEHYTCNWGGGDVVGLGLGG